MNRTQQRSRSNLPALLAAFLAGVLVALGYGAIAEPRVELEMMLGQTKFHAREDGTWWQSGPSSETKNGLISSSYLLGMKYTAGAVGLRYGYTRLGDYSGDNWASVRDEDANHVLNADTCNATTAKDCPALYRGRGRAQGLYFGPTLEHSFGGLTVLGEVGMFLFRSTYDVTVYHPYDNLFVPKGNSFEYNHATGNHATWYWGAELAYKLFRDASAVLLYREYRNIYQQGAMPGGDVGLTGGRTRQLLAGVSIPF